MTGTGTSQTTPPPPVATTPAVPMPPPPRPGQMPFPPPPGPPNEPPKRWTPPDFSAARARQALVACVGIGLAFDLVFRTGFATVAGVVLVFLMTIATIAIAQLGRPMSAALTMAPLFAFFSMARSSPTLHAFNLMAITALFVLVMALGPHGHPFSMTLNALVTRIGESVPVMAATPRWLTAVIRRTGLGTADGGRTRSVIRGLLLATPILIVLQQLLIRADAVFGSLADVSLGSWAPIVHLAFIGVGVIVAAIILGRAADDSERGTIEAPRLLGHTEASVIMTGVLLLLAVFDLIQVITALGGADHLIETAGLTRAQYARSGFFQLIWVAGIVVTVVLGVRAAVQRGDELDASRTRSIIRLSQLSLVACLAIVGVAIQRLFLYADAFGWTMHRIVACTIAGWIGSVLILLAAHLHEPVGRRNWFYGAAGLSALVCIAALNVFNPEAFIVRTNVALATDESFILDVDYLDRLSDDAVPALAEQIVAQDAASAARLGFALCGRTPSPEVESPSHLGFGWNAAEQRAQSVRAALC